MAFVSVQRVFRFLIDLLTDFVFGLIYRTKKIIGPVKNEILLQSASSLAAKIRQQKLKSVDVIEAYIARIEEVQPVINAVTESRFKSALVDAKNADELISSQKFSEEELKQQFPYLGVPFSIKESIGVKDMLNTAGLVANKGMRAEEDADSVALIRKAGGIPLATTNIPELCMWWETSNNIYGRTCNPYDTRRMVGGSSGGEAALLAAGGSVIGIGSDIGGSIRMPAFFSGVFGHKTSKHIVSTEGLIPKRHGVFDDFLSVGPMCRYAEDLLPMLKLLSGNNLSKLHLDEKVDISKLKIYYMEDDGGNPSCTPVDSELKLAQQKILKYFEEIHGIKATKINLKEMFHCLLIWFHNMRTISAPSFISVMAQNKGEVNPVLELLKWIINYSNHTLPCILYAIRQKSAQNIPSSIQKIYVDMAAALKKEFEKILDNNGIFLYPSHPETALFHNQAIFKFPNVSYTAVFNILGFPITQCPLGLSSKGLPLGIQVVAGVGNDHLTIATAVELEKAFGGWKNPNA